MSKKKVLYSLNNGAVYEDSKIKSEDVEPPPSMKLTKDKAIDRCKQLIDEHHLTISDLFKL